MTKIANLRVGLECNHNCLFCTISNDNDKTLSTTEAKLKIIDAIKSGVTILNITGGEPTIRNDLIELIKFAKKKGIKTIELQTNGIAFSNIHFLEKIKKSGLDYILISIHSHIKEKYNYLTNSKDYEKAMLALKNISNSNIRYGISYVITQINKNDLIDFYDFCKQNLNKMPIFYFGLIRPNGNTLNNKKIVPKLTELKIPLNNFFKKLDNDGMLNLAKIENGDIKIEFEGIPLCYMNNYDLFSAETRRKKHSGPYEQSQIYLNKNDNYKINEKVHSELKIKNINCKKCIKNNICVGIWKEYSEIYGTNELIPFRTNNDNVENITKFKINNVDKNIIEKYTNPDIMTGNKCNNCCVMCTSILPMQNYNEPSTENIMQKIDSVCKISNDITITGGEPTIRKDFFKILKYINIKYPDTYIKIVTNGRLLSNKEFINNLISFKNIYIITELHGSTPEIHDKITRSKGSYNETLNGIKNILKTKIPLELRIVISKLNYENIPEILELYITKLNKTTKIVIFPIDLVGNAAINKKITAIKYTEFIPILEKGLEISLRKYNNIELFHIPNCVINEKYRFLIKGITVLKKRVILLESCKMCVLKNTCPEIWKSYITYFGKNEFKAITK